MKKQSKIIHPSQLLQFKQNIKIFRFCFSLKLFIFFYKLHLISSEGEEYNFFCFLLTTFQVQPTK
jgi:hypothetical protein